MKTIRLLLALLMTLFIVGCGTTITTTPENPEIPSFATGEEGVKWLTENYPNGFPHHMVGSLESQEATSSEIKTQGIQLPSGSHRRHCATYWAWGMWNGAWCADKDSYVGIDNLKSVYHDGFGNCMNVYYFSYTKWWTYSWIPNICRDNKRAVNPYHGSPTYVAIHIPGGSYKFSNYSLVTGW